MHRLLLCLPFLALFFASCGVKQGDPAASLSYNPIMSMQTRQQGVADAKRHIRERGFQILRYDIPMAGNGNWDDFHRPFQHFGIEFFPSMLASLDYCRAYNGEMDRQLLKRYGEEYRKFRGKILPPPGAGLYQWGARS